MEWIPTGTYTQEGFPIFVNARTGERAYEQDGTSLLALD